MDSTSIFPFIFVVMIAISVVQANRMKKNPGIDPSLLAWAETNGLPVIDYAVVAHTNGVNIAFSCPKRNLGYTASVPVVPSSWNKKVFKRLRKELKGVGSVQYVKKGSVLTVRIIQNRKDDILYKKLDTTAYILANSLPAAGVAIGQLCKYCGQADCDDCVVQENVCYDCHTACKENEIAKLQTQVEDNETNGNYLLATVCGLVGGVIATLPSIILMLFGWISAWLFALIPLGASFAYRKAKGVQNGFMPVIVTLISLLCTVGAVCLYFYAEYAYDPYAGSFEAFGLGLLIVYLLYDMADFLILLVQALIFSVAGILIASGSFVNTNRDRRRHIESLLRQRSPHALHGDAAQTPPTPAGEAPFQAQ